MAYKDDMNTYTPYFSNITWTNTLPETNIGLPERKPSEKQSSLPKDPFLGVMLFLGSVAQYSPINWDKNGTSHYSQKVPGFSI